MSVERSELNVERSAPKGAVFLSYASQDAEAAKRICDALRGAGVEVWFDQSELVGGDQWDQKIRKQIAECALFMPVISANTQARREGYFRLEWKLAAQRTHMMSERTAFLLPVIIDATRDADADVPGEFRAVQFTKLPGGETPPAFAARVRRLLDGDHALHTGHAAAGTSPDESRGREPAPLLRKPSRALLVVPAVCALIVALGLAGFIWMRPKPADEAGLRSRGAENSARPMKALPPELAALRARIVPETWTQADYDVMRPALDRFIQANPDSADAYALRSCIASIQVLRTFDFGTTVLQAGKADAERALRLDPGCALGELALGMHYAAMTTRGAGIEEARPHMERGLAGLKSDALTFYAETAILAFGLELDRAILASKQQLRVEPDAKFPRWVIALASFVARKADEAQAWAEQSATSDVPGTVVRSYVTLCDVNFYLRANLATARTMLDRVPVAARSHHRIIYSRWLLALAERRPDDAIQELARTPDSILGDYVFHGPKALLAGIAQLGAGRPAPAAAQFREAERTLREMLSTDPEAESLRLALALTLAYAGRADDARVELAAIEPLLRNRQPFLYAGSAREQIAETYAALGDVEGLLPWLRLLLSEPSSMPYTSASFRLDPRFEKIARDARVQALLGEFTPPEARNTNDKSVAVLAFANLSDDKANEYFSDGISEELLNVLAKISGLKVAARTSAFYFKGKEVPVPEIARQLSVAYVVEGSVRKQGDKVRITAQLIKAADGFHVWSETFTRDLKDIFAVQDEIASLIAKNLELKMGIGEVGARQAVSPEAYQEYLIGRAAAARAGSADMRQAVVHFDRAVALEPKYTAAWVQLASAHTRLGRWGGAPTRQSWQAARVAIDRARALEPDSPEVLLALGWILRTGEWNWREAERAFRRALALQPNQPEILAGAAVLLFNIGQSDEAFRLARQAIQLDPLNAGTQIDLSIMFHLSKNWAEAERSARRALQLAPGGTSYHCLLSWGLIVQQRYAEAEAEINLDNSEDGVDRALSLGLLALARGQDKVARDWLARLEEIARTNGDLADLQQNIAWLNTSLGEKERAFAALEKAYTSRDPSMAWLLNSWWLEPLYSDPRWPALLRKIGLAEEQLK